MPWPNMGPAFDRKAIDAGTMVEPFVAQYQERGQAFPFKRADWSRTHAKQAELQAYLEETVSDWGLWSHLRLGVAVDRAVWDEDTHLYTLTLDTGETVECNVLMAATGFLKTNPNPSRHELAHGVSGNLCRCQDYDKILTSLMRGGEYMRRA